MQIDKSIIIREQLVNNTIIITASRDSHQPMVQYVQNNRGSIFVTISLNQCRLRGGSSRDTAATEVLQSKQCIAKYYCHIKHTKAQALGLSIRNESKRLFGSELLLLSCIISVMDGWWYIGRIYLTY